jgi:arginyl-tRNA--protein-N-Asp/Glu arginylyltransferase
MYGDATGCESRYVPMASVQEMPMLTIVTCSCDTTMLSIGSRRRGNVRVDLWRCSDCASVRTLVETPTWINAVSRCVAELRDDVMRER